MEAKARVYAMDIRYIEEADPMRQAILEMYVALSLEVPFNGFDNHNEACYAHDLEQMIVIAVDQLLVAQGRIELPTP